MAGNPGDSDDPAVKWGNKASKPEKNFGKDEPAEDDAGDGDQK